MNFFVRVDLPFSVVRGEQFILQVDVFNYQQIAMTVNMGEYVKVLWKPCTIHRRFKLDIILLTAITKCYVIKVKSY